MGELEKARTDDTGAAILVFEITGDPPIAPAGTSTDWAHMQHHSPIGHTKLARNIAAELSSAPELNGAWKREWPDEGLGADIKALFPQRPPWSPPPTQIIEAEFPLRWELDERE